MSGATVTVTGGPTVSVSESGVSITASGAVTAVSVSALAFSGAYADLTGKPTLFDGAYASLTGKPTLFDGAYSSLTGRPTLGTASSHDTGDFATAAQGAKADTALQSIPNPSSSSLGGVRSIAGVSHQWIASISTLGVPSLSQPAFSDISGSVAAAQLPNPGASSLGGVQSFAAVSNQFVTSISTAGVIAAAQPAFSNLSGSVAASQMPALTGDATTSAGAVATTLATVNSNVGTFGSATKAGVVTVNAKGLVTAASESTVTPAVGSITGLASGIATWLATPSSANLAAAITDESGSGSVAFGTVAAAATASTIAARDASANLLANNFLSNYATTATAAGTTTLTVASAYQQFFTGVTTQTVTLPVTSTLALGYSFMVMNLSTGNVTVNSSGGNAVFVVPGGSSIIVACVLTSGTTAASWNVMAFNAMAVSGKMLMVNNSLTLAGTDGTTMTFPSTSATVARTDAANVFTGHQTIEGVATTGATGTGKLVFDGTPTLVTPVLGVASATSLSIGVVATTYKFMLATPGVISSQLHVNSASPADDTGFYITNTSASSSYVSSGVGFNGTNWVAKATTAWIFGGNGTTITWYSNTGLTAGNTFTPTPMMRLAAGDMTIGDSTASPVAHLLLLGDSSRPATDSNIGGANGTIRSGAGTGTGTPSSLILQSPIAVASGTGGQTQTTGLTIFNGTAIRPSYAVASLPTAAAGLAGAMAWVTDANATTFLSTVAGGGANKVPVSCNGTNWVIG